METKELRKVLAGFGLAALIAGAAAGCAHKGASGCGGGKSGCGGCGGKKDAGAPAPAGQQQPASSCGGMKK